MKCIVNPEHGEMMIWGDRHDEYYCPLNHYEDPKTGKYLAQGIIVTEVMVDDRWTPKVQRAMWYSTTKPKQRELALG